MPSRPFEPTPVVHPASCDELRSAVVAARRCLQQVLADRRRTHGTLATWHGPHRARYDAEADALATDGERLDDLLRRLLASLDAGRAAVEAGRLPP